MADAPAEVSDQDTGSATSVSHFSYACFPLERVLVLAGVLVGVSIAAGVVWQYLEMVELSQVETGPYVYDLGNARLFAGLTVAMAVVLTVFGVLHLQLRAATSVTVTGDGVMWERAAVLPFGWLAGRRAITWKRADRVELRHRRTALGGRQPVLEVESPAELLKLGVADAWPVDESARPWMPREPKGGWSDHSLVLAAMSAYATAMLDDSLKSGTAKAD